MFVDSTHCNSISEVKFTQVIGLFRVTVRVSRYTAINDHIVTRAASPIAEPSFFPSPLGWHALPSHASAEACLTGWPNAQPQGRD